MKVQTFGLCLLASVLTVGCEIKPMVALEADRSPRTEILDPSAPGTVVQNPEVESHLDINRYPLNKLVCNPLSSTSSAPQRRQGLVGDLYTLGSSQPSYSDVDDTIRYGAKSDRKLFFSKLEIPTRMFSAGFPAETGELLKNDAGEVLMERFGMELRTILTLSPNDGPGDYQLAALGDDGITVHVVNEDGTETNIIDIRYVHPTQLGCANQLLPMSPQSKVKLKIRYAQGPRYHIALMLLWRKVTASTPAEHRCGWAGNHTFFNPDQNSAPTSHFLAMVASGWKVIQPENFTVPEDVPFNPCAGEAPPEIDGLQVMVQSNGRIHVSWKTDVGAASQVLYRNLSTGEETLVAGKTKVQKNHQFEIGGLDPNADYSVSAISFSESFGKVISAPITVRPAK